MRCKSFILRINHEYTERDEGRLNEFLESVRVERVHANTLPGDPPYWSIVVLYQERMVDSGDARASEFYSDVPLSNEEQDLFEALMLWRGRRAEKDGVLPYVIAPNACLKQIAKTRVRTETDLMGIIGFGDRRIERYGKDILQILNTFYDSQYMEE